MTTTNRIRAALACGAGALLLACATRELPPPVTPEPPPIPDVAEEVEAGPRLMLANGARAELVARIDALIDAPQFRNARWGVLVVHSERGDTVYSRDAGKLFLPASNQKLVTGAVALRRLGPEFRFTTTFAAAGPIAAGELRGNLVIHGRGDPSFSARMHGDAMTPLLEMADSLRARGIRRIAGNVIAGDTVFPFPERGYGLAWENLRTRFGAPVAELMFNEGSSRLSVSAGARVGSPVRASLVPAIGYPRVRVTATTVAARAAAPPSDTLRIEYVGDGVTIAGGLPVGETATLDVVHPDARAAFLVAFRAALSQRGITVGGVRHEARDGGTLFTYRSAPLRELSAVMQKPSQNQIAESLKRALALELTGVGASDSGRRVLGDELLALGAEEDGFIIGDAAGLSRYSFLTPETIVRLLHAMRADSVFVASLPLMGREGTLSTRFRGTSAEAAGRAKTGSISNGIALSGYLPTADDAPLLFSIIANNHSVPDAEVMRTIDLIVAMLAEARYAEIAQR